MSPQRAGARFGSALALAAAVTLVPLTAHGATDPNEISTELTCASNASQPTELDLDLLVPKFDSGLGTFLRAEYSLRLVTETELVFTNAAPNAQNAAATATVDAELTYPGGTLTVSVVTTFPRTSVPAAGSVVSSGSGDEESGLLTSEDLGWVGVGDVVAHLTTLTGIGVSGGGGNVSTQQTTTAVAQFCVQYFYVALPASTTPPATTPPVTTAPATTPVTTPPVTTAPATTPVQSLPAPTTSGPTLPETGSSSLPLAMSAVAIAGVGAAIVAAARRRHVRTDR